MGFQIKVHRLRENITFLSGVLFLLLHVQKEFVTTAIAMLFVYITVFKVKGDIHLHSDPLPPCVLDLVLLACNWGTMGDSFFVCHHLAAIYAYTYVLVSLLEFSTLCKPEQ